MNATVIKKYKNGNALVEITRTVKTIVHVSYNHPTMLQEEIDAGEWCYGYKSEIDPLTDKNTGDLIATALLLDK